MSAPRLHGLLAEFAAPERLVSAAAAARARGYRAMDAYAPFPVEGLSEALGLSPSRMRLIILLGGLTGCAGGYGLQYWGMVLSYPINTGGRPLNSWPAFIPITFELTVLFAAFAAVFGMLAINRLPKPYHPVFNVPEFRLASQTRFFLCLQADDLEFGEESARRFLISLGPLAIHEVER